MKIEYLCPTFKMHIDFPPGQWLVWWCRDSTCMHAVEVFPLNLQHYSLHTLFFFLLYSSCFSQQMLSKEISNDRSKTPIMVTAPFLCLLSNETLNMSSKGSNPAWLAYLLTYRPSLRAHAARREFWICFHQRIPDVKHKLHRLCWKTLCYSPSLNCYLQPFNAEMSLHHTVS